MKLSVIIVNYNVRHFLEQCLNSVFVALKGIEAEVFVVDNNSVDGSAEMVREKFPQAMLFANKENFGFSKANNQAIRESIGEYVLLLNPDTVVEEDTFRKVCSYMDENPEAGGLGVMMVDGKGRFLPESKRGLPTPAAAFWKISGLSKVFPKSPVFGKYHLGYLDANEIHEVDILSGAFMLMRSKALEISGLLDETFFMYGEDIDLSYRIQKAGYKNIYFPETRIIHYKGESTKKGSLNYVRMFYQAMIIFADKHFKGKKAKWFSLLINTAIYFRALIAMGSRLVKSLALPFVDAVLIFGGILGIKQFWAKYVHFGDAGYYPPEFIRYEVPAFILVWLLALFFAGAYDKPVKLKKAIRGVLAGMVIILVIYALLPESLRYSRALILLGSFWALLALPMARQVFHWLGLKSFRLEAHKNKRYAIVGSKEEIDRVTTLLVQTTGKPGFVANISPDDNFVGGEYSGNIPQLPEIVRIYGIDELVFCAKDLAAARIIDAMSRFKNSSVDFKIAPPESISLIGSNSIHTAGDVYTIDVDSVNSLSNRRNKRMLDIITSTLFLITSPLLLFLNSAPMCMYRNIFNVLKGKRSWVGYCNRNPEKLPDIRKGVLCPADGLIKGLPDEHTKQRLDNLYARDYKVSGDISIIMRNLRNLGK